MECRDVKYILRRGTMDMMEISIRIRSINSLIQGRKVKDNSINPSITVTAIHL